MSLPVHKCVRKMALGCAAAVVLSFIIACFYVNIVSSRVNSYTHYEHYEYVTDGCNFKPLVLRRPFVDRCSVSSSLTLLHHSAKPSWPTDISRRARYGKSRVSYCANY